MKNQQNPLLLYKHNVTYTIQSVTAAEKKEKGIRNLG